MKRKELDSKRAHSKGNGGYFYNIIFIVGLFVISLISILAVLNNKAQLSSRLGDRIKFLQNYVKSGSIGDPNLIVASVDTENEEAQENTLPPMVFNDTPEINFIDSRLEPDCPNRKPPSEYILPKHHKANGSFDMHFIHIPKCGGTSMTAVLRQVACSMDPQRNVDCCTNPGFCDWHAFRRCQSIKGCINHFPQRPWIFKAIPSITIMREPTSRLISAWFYRGHSPNLDFFQVRPEFKEIQLGKRPRVTFEEYIDMVEYQNIQTRMLGADSFPYRNITVDQQVFCQAIEAIDHMFFVGLQEAYEISVKVMLRELQIEEPISIVRERDQSGGSRMKKQKDEIRNNESLMGRVRKLNDWDRRLYEYAKRKFCVAVKKYDDLWEELQQSQSTSSPLC